ncbi:Soluble lytic murein transglycosylase precursor [hydrothermal vent metagenome]|uniref:Soluble lytic murein transglycosylase n=1 Tax=hydrothermal vent metagenome TaxID=652676 RepID=A0A3B0T3P7_9ZZZZ
MMRNDMADLGEGCQMRSRWAAKLTALTFLAGLATGIASTGGRAAPPPKAKPQITPASTAGAIPAPKPKPGAAPLAVSVAKRTPPGVNAPPAAATAPKPFRSRAGAPTRKPKVAETAALRNLKDLNGFIAVIDHARAGRFNAAYAGLTPAMGPVAGDLVSWLYFRDGGAREDPKRIQSFLTARKTWPNSSLMRNSIEAAILLGYGGRDFARDYFAKTKPRSGAGMIARGALALEDRNAKEARKWFARAWRQKPLNASIERRVLSLCRNCITASDEKARLDTMMYNGSTKTALRAAGRLGRDKVRLVEARIAANKGLRKTAAAIKRVPAALRSDLGLRYSQIRYLRRKASYGDARKLMLGAPVDHKKLVAPGSWWTERRILARQALGNDTPEGVKPQDAYRLAAAHGYSKGNNFAEGEFLAGWIALRYLNDPKTALVHFKRLRAGVRLATSVSRAEYWLGRTRSALGDEAAAREHYQAAAEKSRRFYGQLAREMLGGVSVLLELPADARITAEDRARFAARPMVQAARLLGAANATDLAGRFVSALSYRIRAPGEYALLARLAEGLSLPHVAVRVGKVALSRDVPLLAAAFPLDNFPMPAGASVEAALLGGLARQESEFNWRASSRVGARGLMQIMPGTAKDIAKNHNLPLSLKRLVEDPIYNVTMGEAYLGELIERFEGSYILAIAGYNAGPGRVGQWLKRYGDPRTAAIDPLDWIENIPFNETRAYVQRVLENLQIYRARIAGQPQPIQLTADMTRGSKAFRRASLSQ